MVLFERRRFGLHRYLLVLVLLASGGFGESLVEISPATRADLVRLERSGLFDVQSLHKGVLTGIAYDVEAIQSMGYHPRILADLDSLRSTVWAQYRDQYHSYADMAQILSDLALTHPEICVLETLGFSVQGRALLSLKISDYPTLRELEPEVRIVGTHHGNEWISTEIPLLLAQYLVNNYGSDPTVTTLVNEREIYIIPMVNPDGHEMQQRRNANSVDLNRDYGYMWDGWGNSPAPYSQPETQAMYLFAQQHNFVLSLSYHSYGEIVNYIWNYSPIEPPDSSLIRQLSQMYASYNGYWVTEGYQWYETHGDLNDYAYGIDSDMDWTIELGESFVPPPSQIQPIWLENRDAILAFIQKAGQGIIGVVIDSVTGDTLKHARIWVEEIGWPVFTDPVSGDFVRVLKPGTYTLRVEANGYFPKTIPNVLVQPDQLTQMTVFLRPGGGSYAYKYVVVEQEDPNNSFANQTLPPWGLGAPDDQYVSLGVGGMVIVDVTSETPITDTFTVYEGADAAGPEGYTVYASANWNGPWTLVGTGTGTQTFSLAAAGMGYARYLKIVDDGDGNPNAPTAGFDLDAIEVTPPSGIMVVLARTWVTSQDSSSTLYPGDTVALYGLLKNYGSLAVTNLIVFLQSEDSLAMVLDTVQDLGVLDPGDSIQWGPLHFVVADSVPQGAQVHLQLSLTGDPGYNASYFLSFPIVTPLDYIIWDPDPNHSSGPVVEGLLQQMGLTGVYTNDLSSVYAQIPGTQVLFVCLGIYPNNYVIYAESPDADTLISYLLHGGRLYMEGGDVWYYDPSAGGFNFNPYFGINPQSDGSSDLGTLQGVPGTFTSNMTFSYVGENNWIDRIQPMGNAFAIWNNLAPVYTCGVAQVETTATDLEYRTVGVSFEFGGLQAAGTSPEEYLQAILDFFGVGVQREESNRPIPVAPTHLKYSVPMRSTGTLWLTVQVPTSLTLELLDITGRRIATLLHGRVDPGTYALSLAQRTSHPLPTGVYFLRQRTPSHHQVQKLILIRDVSTPGGIKP